MQLSDLLPAVGDLIPYDYETIRTPEYETLLAGLLAGAVSQTAPHFVQIGGIPGAGKTTFCKIHIGTNGFLSVLTRLWKACPLIGRTFTGWARCGHSIVGKCRLGLSVMKRCAARLKKGRYLAGTQRRKQSAYRTD